MADTTAGGAGSTAGKTLRRARFFFHQAEVMRSSDREAFGLNIETAIVWGRSITFHLQKQFKRHPGFDSWYTSRQENMRSDPFFRFFVETRNFVLKEGPVGVKRVVTLSATIDAFLSVNAELSFQRGRPWYRRSPRIIWEDLSAALMRPIRRWRENRRELARQRARAARGPATTATAEMYFDDPMWTDTPALELLRQYLDRLEALVTEAEARFGGDPQ